MTQILVLFCGGTLIMKKNPEGALVAPEKEEAMNILMGLEPRLQEIADIDMHFVANIDSTNMQPSIWNEITSVIAEEYTRYDGFIITHGTDTMAYTASALSFSLQGIGKPVVLTGSQIPGTEIGNDARRNFINAVKLACRNVAGVFIVFNDRVIRGCRASKVSESDLDAFLSINLPDVGDIRLEMRLNKGLPPRHDQTWLPKAGFEHDISILTLAPGSDPYDLIHLLDSDRIKGIVIQAYGSGNIPYNFYGVFEKAREVRVPVIIRSQCQQGVTSMSYYDVGLQALKLGVIEARDMSLEATVTKLMWAIHHVPYEEIPKVMNTNLAGELMDQ